MKKYLSVFVLLIVVQMAGAQTMRSLFVEMTDSLLPLMTANNRKDCIDFLDAGMRAVVTNRLDGKSELVAMDDSFIYLKTTASSYMQMRMLPLADGGCVLCVVNGVSAEACNSGVRFYTTDWLPVEVSFDAPSIEDFFIPSDSVAEAVELSDIYLVRYTLSGASDSLRAEYTMPAYMMREDSVIVASQLRPLFYRWNGRGFIRE